MVVMVECDVREWVRLRRTVLQMADLVALYRMCVCVCAVCGYENREALHAVRMPSDLGKSRNCSLEPRMTRYGISDDLIVHLPYLNSLNGVRPIWELKYKNTARKGLVTRTIG